MGRYTWLWCHAVSDVHFQLTLLDISALTHNHTNWKDLTHALFITRTHTPHMPHTHAPISQMYEVVPKSGPIHSLIQLEGYNFPDGVFESYDRFFVGDAICGTRDHVTNQLYGSVWAGSLYLISCLANALQVGGVNATALIAGTGASWNHSQALYPGPDWSLVMYEVYPGEREGDWSLVMYEVYPGD